MTTYAFQPTPVAPFQFQPTLDGAVYTAIITWNVYGRRWYLNLYTLTGTLVVCLALIASPAGFDINLVAGYFSTSSLVYREGQQQFEVTP